jgi:hypothetical protein
MPQVVIVEKIGDLVVVCGLFAKRSVSRRLVPRRVLPLRIRLER